MNAKITDEEETKIEVISLDSAHEPVVVQCDQLIYSSGINPVESHEPRPRPTPIIIAKK